MQRVFELPHETLSGKIFQLYKVCKSLGFVFFLTSPSPSCPCLNIPHPHIIFLLFSSEATTANEWFSPQATPFTFIKEKHSSFLGVLMSKSVSSFWVALSFIFSKFLSSSQAVSIPHWPRSFVPHAYNSSLSLRNIENVDPANTLTILIFLK